MEIPNPVATPDCAIEQEFPALYNQSKAMHPERRFLAVPRSAGNLKPPPKAARQQIPTMHGQLAPWEVCMHRSRGRHPDRTGARLTSLHSGRPLQAVDDQVRARSRTRRFQSRRLSASWPKKSDAASTACQSRPSLPKRITRVTDPTPAYGPVKMSRTEAMAGNTIVKQKTRPIVTMMHMTSLFIGSITVGEKHFCRFPLPHCTPISHIAMTADSRHRLRQLVAFVLPSAERGVRRPAWN